MVLALAGSILAVYGFSRAIPQPNTSLQEMPVGLVIFGMGAALVVLAWTIIVTHAR